MQKTVLYRGTRNNKVPLTISVFVKWQNNLELYFTAKQSNPRTINMIIHPELGFKVPFVSPGLHVGRGHLILLFGRHEHMDRLDIQIHNTKT